MYVNLIWADFWLVMNLSVFTRSCWELTDELPKVDPPVIGDLDEGGLAPELISSQSVQSPFWIRFL